MTFSHRGTVQRALAAGLWLFVVSVGFGMAWRYEAVPGSPASRSDWPGETSLRRSAQKPTIVHFVHPDCPCSRAGLTQLADLVRRRAEHARLIVVVAGESGQTAPLARSENARLARELPGASLVFDPHGAEARRFGASTSGQTLAFSSQGRLLFRGGVTVARGHYGDSDGLAALSAVLDGRAVPATTTPVYGCALFSGAR